MAESFSSHSFFASQPAPSRLGEEVAAARAFVEMHAKDGRRVVLVTSGGTTVPLEQNVVRFLDNFSAGTRGAASAEHFLRTGKYAVIFMHRQHSLQPFSRHYSHSTNPFLDLLEVDPEPASASPNVAFEKARRGEGDLFPPLPPIPGSVTSPRPKRPHSSLPLGSPSLPLGSPSLPLGSPALPSGSNASPSTGIHIADPHLSPLRSLLRSYKLVRSLGLLHTITFVTVTEYLWLLKAVAEVMGDRDVGLGRRGMFYLAAAVSDFFVPQQKMSEHKIQSGKGSLILEMDQVPKILHALTSQWSHSSYTVSFKLETDQRLLIPKARASLERYGHQLVVGNELNTRKWKVVFVHSPLPGEKGEGGEEWILLEGGEKAAEEGGKEIEEEIVKRLSQRHGAWVDAGDDAK